MVSPDILIGPRLKVERAYRHIDELRFLTNPLSPDLFEIAVEEQRRFAIEAQPSSLRLVYRPKKPIPETLAVIVGDAVHNLRSALDHLGGGIIRSIPVAERPVDKPYFPMHPERENLKADKTLAAIEQALPGAKKTLLEEVRPENGPNEKLWTFNSLSNLDKHNLVIPTVTFAEVSNVNIVVSDGSRVVGCSVSGDAARKIGIFSSNIPARVENQLNTAVDITFAEGDHGFAGEAVIPTLTNIAELVTETINAFARLISPEENPSG